MSDAPEHRPDDKPEKPDDDAWIERLSSALGHLGFNRTRIRWKLIRWKEERRRAARRREQQVQHITYAHKTCAECGAVQDKDAAVCTSCNAKLGKRGWQVLGRLGILAPVGLSLSTILALALLAVYAREWILAGGGLKSPSGYLLVDLGGRWPPLMDAEPWRHLTAVFLHANLLHLAFNLFAIAQVGPRIEELYGRGTMLGLFVLTGVIANLGALYLGKVYGVGIGASGGLMGLIGIAAGYGQRQGTARGRAIRNDMLKWAAYTFIFGFAVKADNWAHLFGLLPGLAFGFALRPETWTKKLLLPLRLLLGLAGLAGMIAAVVLVFTRTPSAPDEESYNAQYQQQSIREWTASLARVCTPHYAGDAATALAELKKMYSGVDELPDGALTPAVVEETCESLQIMRASCAKDRSKLPIEQKRAFDETCDMYKPVFDAVPVRAPRVPAPDSLPEQPPAGSAGSGSGSASSVSPTRDPLDAGNTP